MARIYTPVITYMSKVPFTNEYYSKTTGYCYHSVNVITFCLDQSDLILPPPNRHDFFPRVRDLSSLKP